MKDKQCSACWEVPCICGKIYSDTTSDNLARLLRGIEVMLIKRGEHPEFLLNGRKLADHITGIKTKKNTITTKDFVDSITSEEWHSTFQEFILQHNTMNETWDKLQSDLASKLRGRSILWILLWSKSFTNISILNTNYYGLILPMILKSIFAEQLIPVEQCDHIIKLVACVEQARYANIQQYIEKIINVCDPSMIPWYETIKELSLMRIDNSVDIIKAFLKLLCLLSGLEPFSLDGYITLQSFDAFAISDAEDKLMEILSEFNSNPY